MISAPGWIGSDIYFDVDIAEASGDAFVIHGLLSHGGGIGAVAVDIDDPGVVLVIAKHAWFDEGLIGAGELYAEYPVCLGGMSPGQLRCQAAGCLRAFLAHRCQRCLMHLEGPCQAESESCQVYRSIYDCAVHYFAYFILEVISMVTFILLSIFFLIARDAHRTAKRKSAKKLSDAKKGIVTVTTVVIDDGDPW